MKSNHTGVPGLTPDKIAPTVGQNSAPLLLGSNLVLALIILATWICLAGKIKLPSAILQFYDLGGQSGIRSIWSRYYDDCHAVVYIIDDADRERLNEGWEVFGEP